MPSIGENAPEKKHQKIEFYQSKFPTRDHPKKYQTFSLKESPCRQQGLNSEPLGYNGPESATIATAPARHIVSCLHFYGY